MREIFREINPKINKQNIIPAEQYAGARAFANSKGKEATKKELVPKERTFSLLEEKPDLKSIRFWGREKVAKNIRNLISTGAIKIAIEKHPEKLEEFFEKTDSAKLFNLLKENSELDVHEIRENLNWGADKTYREIVKLDNMGLGEIIRKKYKKICLIEPEKDKIDEKEMIPKIDYVLGTSVGRTFGSLEEKPDLNSVMSWKGNVAKNIEQLIEVGAIEIVIQKHPEKLGSSGQFNKEIPIVEKGSLSQKKRGPKISLTKDPEKIKIKRKIRIPPYLIRYTQRLS